MEFTYKAYKELIILLKKNEYSFATYFNYKDKVNPVIFRHDVDSSLERALKIALLENQMGVTSTYFILLSTDFYNVFSKKSFGILKKIQDLNHEIGLHFDEKRYIINSLGELNEFVEKEKRILETLLNKEIRSVSMHRPSKWILESNVEFEGILNTYSKEFFNDFKYLSDSRMYWKEDVFKIINEKKFNQLHILTHPFWYAENKESLREKLYNFINNATIDRYSYQKENIRDLEEIVKEEEISNEIKSERSN